MTEVLAKPSPTQNAVQLGFSVEYEDQEHRMFVGHKLPSWRDWDGGQIGGRPSWLQPRDIPKNFLECKNCDDPLVFICQLYAPADDVSKESYHRSLYVFACPSKKCSAATTGSVRVLRAQLPEENPFLPIEEDNAWSQHLPDTYDINLCHVCGQKGKGKCPIQSYHFCGKHHQKEHKKFIFDKQQLSTGGDFTFLPSVYHESELVVEEESTEKKDETASAKPKSTLFPDADTKLFSKKDGKGDGQDDDEVDDEDLEQKDLNAITGASQITDDQVTMDFYSRVNDPRDVQDQCLRYLRWPDNEQSDKASMPLWIRSDFQPDKVPDCACCGEERRFEFQIMPQMIHHLLKDHQTYKAHQAVRTSLNTDERKKAVMAAASIIEQTAPEHMSPQLVDANKKAIDALQKDLMGGDDGVEWGIISVYTCTGSCGGLEVTDPENELGAYKEEFAWKQPSLDT